MFLVSTSSEIKESSGVMAMSPVGWLSICCRRFSDCSSWLVQSWHAWSMPSPSPPYSGGKTCGEKKSLRVSWKSAPCRCIYSRGKRSLVEKYVVQCGIHDARQQDCGPSLWSYQTGRGGSWRRRVGKTSARWSDGFLWLSAEMSPKHTQWMISSMITCTINWAAAMNQLKESRFIDVITNSTKTEKFTFTVSTQEIFLASEGVTCRAWLKLHPFRSKMAFRPRLWVSISREMISDVIRLTLNTWKADQSFGLHCPTRSERESAWYNQQTRLRWIICSWPDVKHTYTDQSCKPAPCCRCGPAAGGRRGRNCWGGRAQTKVTDRCWSLDCPSATAGSSVRARKDTCRAFIEFTPTKKKKRGGGYKNTQMDVQVLLNVITILKVVAFNHSNVF